MQLASKFQHRSALFYISIVFTFISGGSPALSVELCDTGGMPCAREEHFEFSKEPVFRKTATDRYEIEFTVSANCDVTVGILGANDRILRHLASGVMGANAPEPLEKNSLAQKLIWDGKDDFERYVEEPQRCRVRVSLGLKPTFDKVLLWHPNRLAWSTTGLACDKDGVYVFNQECCPVTNFGHAVPDLTHILVYDHDGNYQRTILPLKSDKVTPNKYVKSPLRGQGEPLAAETSLGKDGPPYGLVLPTGHTVISATDTGAYFAPLESNAFSVANGIVTCVVHTGTSVSSSDGEAAPQYAAKPELRFLRLKTDGSMPEEGFYSKELGDRFGRGPCWICYSPDKKWIYVSGLAERTRIARSYGREDWAYAVRDRKEIASHAIFRVSTTLDSPMEVFIGKKDEPGNDNQHFSFPEGVACDEAGHILVADKGNDRVQVFGADGAYLKTIPVKGPYQVAVHPKNGAVYVLSHPALAQLAQETLSVIKLKNLESPSVAAEVLLKAPELGTRVLPTFCVDSFAQETTLWLVSPEFHVQMWADKGSSFELKRDLQTELAKEWKGTAVGVGYPCHIVADPYRPHVYVTDARGIAGSRTSTRINVESGLVESAPPITTFGYDGLAYLRRNNQISRYDPETGKPVAFDYGEGSDGTLQYAYSSGDGLGIGVSPKGDVLFHDRWPPVPGFISALNQNVGENRLHMPTYMLPDNNKTSGQGGAANLEKYVMRQFYPGRVNGAASAILHFDSRGQLKTNDVIAATTVNTSGVKMDSHGNVYVGISCPKVSGGKVLIGNSIAKFGPGGGRLVVNGPGVAVPLQTPPDRAADFSPDRNTDGHGAPDDKGPHDEHGLGDKMWGEGMQWCFGGYYPFGRGHCICLSASFDLDFYARSFIPESHRNSISILDTNGNFILRIGSYGNQDDRGPEIRMAHCRFVAVNDTRLYINDVVNKRILSISLKYEKEAVAPLN